MNADKRALALVAAMRCLPEDGDCHVSSGGMNGSCERNLNLVEAFIVLPDCAVGSTGASHAKALDSLQAEIKARAALEGK